MPRFHPIGNDPRGRFDCVKKRIPTLFGIVERLRDRNATQFDALFFQQEPANGPRTHPLRRLENEREHLDHQPR